MSHFNVLWIQLRTWLWGGV